MFSEKAKLKGKNKTKKQRKMENIERKSTKKSPRKRKYYVRKKKRKYYKNLVYEEK